MYGGIRVLGAIFKDDKLVLPPLFFLMKISGDVIFSFFIMRLLLIKSGTKIFISIFFAEKRFLFFPDGSGITRFSITRPLKKSYEAFLKKTFVPAMFPICVRINSLPCSGRKKWLM